MKLNLIELIKRNRAGPTSDAPESAVTQEATMAAKAPPIAPAANVTPEPAPAPVAAVVPPTPPSPPAAPVAELPKAPTAATFAELNAEFADDPAFIVEAQAKAMTMPDAQRAYAAKLRKQNADLKALQGLAPGEKPIAGVSKGSAPAVKSGRDSSDPYIAECERVMAEKSIEFAAATVIVNKTHPALREAYVGRKSA